jgi:hypothetical protein
MFPCSGASYKFPRVKKLDAPGDLFVPHMFVMLCNLLRNTCQCAKNGTGHLISKNISKACASLKTPKFKDKNHNVGCQGEFARLEKITP